MLIKDLLCTRPWASAGDAERTLSQLGGADMGCGEAAVWGGPRWERVATTLRCVWGVLAERGHAAGGSAAGPEKANGPGMFHAGCQHLEAGLCQGGASG